MPYQLHCCGPEQRADELDDERLLDVTTLDEDERIDDDETDEGAEDESTDEDTELDLTEEVDELLPLQTAPVTTGVSTAPLVLICKPKDAVCPG